MGGGMWFRKYRDYPIDRPLIKERVETGKGIVGCEMHELNGWGSQFHQHVPRKRGWWAKIINGNRHG